MKTSAENPNRLLAIQNFSWGFESPADILNFRRTFRIFSGTPSHSADNGGQTAEHRDFSAELFAGGLQRRKSGRSPVLPAILPAPRPTKTHLRK